VAKGSAGGVRIGYKLRHWRLNPLVTAHPFITVDAKSPAVARDFHTQTKQSRIAGVKPHHVVQMDYPIIIIIIEKREEAALLSGPP